MDGEIPSESTPMAGKWRTTPATNTSTANSLARSQVAARPTIIVNQQHQQAAIQYSLMLNQLSYQRNLLERLVWPAAAMAAASATAASLASLRGSSLAANIVVGKSEAEEKKKKRKRRKRKRRRRNNKRLARGESLEPSSGCANNNDSNDNDKKSGGEEQLDIVTETCLGFQKPVAN